MLLHPFLGIVLCSGLTGQVPTIDAPAIKKPVQEATILATVRLVNVKQNNSGSGVILAPRKGPVVYILTAAHVVRGLESVDVHVFTGKSYPKEERVYAAVPVIARREKDNQDLALLRIAVFGGESDGLKVLPIADLPREKSFAGFASGCEGGEAPTLRPVPIRDSVRVAKRGMPQPARFWQCAEKPGLGASGGPLVTSSGQLLGICSGVQGQYGYYCHLEDIHDFLKKSGFVMPKK